MKVTSIMKTEYPTICCNQIRQTRGGGGEAGKKAAHILSTTFANIKALPKLIFGDTKFGWVGSGGVEPGPRTLFR